MHSPSKHFAATSSPRNPISLRLYKVFGATFDDDGTKDALRTLSEFYVPPTTSTLSNGKTVDHDSEDSDNEVNEEVRDLPGIADYLSTTSTPGDTVPGERAAKARKNLRLDVENKLAEASHKFLKAFGEVDQQLDVLQDHIAAMKMHCDEAESQLEETNKSCKSLLERAGSLRQERQIIVAKQSIVSLFLSRFTLNDEEVEAMVSRDVPIGQRFFNSMDKTERIRQDCQVLMAGEEGPTQVGLDIMATTSSYLEQAYEKIFRWCSFEFRQMAREAQIDVTSAIREATSRLRRRPELLSEALGFLSQTRQATLFAAFTDALTRGGRGGLPRPIELHAHDPMRYVGDMLAWVHQCIAAEREFLESLFGITSDGRMVGSVRKFDQGNEDEEWIKELMDAAMSKLCIPLKVRVQQTIRSQESSIMSFKIANLLQFYMLTMQRTIGEDALLSLTLKQITDVSYKTFFDSTIAQGRTISRTSLDLDDQEVTPPLVIQDHGQVLREIMVVYESSILENESLEEQNAGFKPIVDAMLDPAVEVCLTVSEEKQKARPRWDKQVFVLNCLAYLKSVLEPFSFTGEKQQSIDQLIEEKVLSLIDDHYETILHDAGLEEAVAACTANEANEPLSHLPATQPSQLQQALRKFSTWLSDVEVVHSPRLVRLAAQQLHTRIHHAALERLAKSYQRLCEEVRKPSNKYEAASTLLGSERPFGQVRLLWQIFGLQDIGE